MRRSTPGGWVAVALIASAIGCRGYILQGPAGIDPPPVSMTDPLTVAMDRPSQVVSQPIAAISNVRTVRSPEAPPRPISLAECIAIALENGRAGDTSIRVFAYDPALVGATIEQALSRFDAIWQTGVNWQTTDEPTGLASQAVLTQSSVFNLQESQYYSRIIKPLATGGVAGITFGTDYQFGTLSSPVNPAYQPRLTFLFEQPLLQGFGVEINQLRASHPGSQLLPFATRGSGQGIVLARVDFDRSTARLRNQVQEMLLAVERAYWGLYQSYWDLYTREVGYRQAHAAWQIGLKMRKHAELTVQDLAQLEAQYQLFRVQRLDAVGDGAARPGVLEAERRLRLALGLPGEDGCRLVPSDTPSTAQYMPCWDVAQAEALTRRPDLEEIRQDVKAAQLRLIRARNHLLPELRFVSTYDVNSIGTRLDGAGEQNALRNLAENNFNNWSLGLRFEIPIGFREASAQVRFAQLDINRNVSRLLDVEQQAVLQLQRSYRNLIQAQDRIPILTARRNALAIQYQSLFELFIKGEAAQLFVMLEAQRNWADALREEQAGIMEYNLALAAFERDKGTLLEHDNVLIAEGPVPKSVAARASDTLRQRDAALLLRERPGPTKQASGRESMDPPCLAEWMLGRNTQDQTLPTTVDTPPRMAPTTKDVPLPELPEPSNRANSELPAPSPTARSGTGFPMLPTPKEEEFSLTPSPRKPKIRVLPVPGPPAKSHDFASPPIVPMFTETTSTEFQSAKKPGIRILPIPGNAVAPK